jgi:hypothetical protein
MSVYEELNNVLKAAMRERNSEVVNYIRVVKSRVTEYEVANNLNRDEMPNDSLMIQIISTHIKSLKKAVDLLEQGGGMDLKAEYEREIKFFETYMPNQDELTSEIEDLVDEAMEQVGKNFGQIMRYVMKGRTYDGSTVKSIVLKKVKG